MRYIPIKIGYMTINYYICESGEGFLTSSINKLTGIAKKTIINMINLYKWKFSYINTVDCFTFVSNNCNIGNYDRVLIPIETLDNLRLRVQKESVQAALKEVILQLNPKYPIKEVPTQLKVEVGAETEAINKEPKMETKKITINNKTVTWISGNFGQGFTVKDIADMCQISRTYILNLIKRYKLKTVTINDSQLSELKSRNILVRKVHNKPKIIPIESVDELIIHIQSAEAKQMLRDVIKAVRDPSYNAELQTKAFGIEKAKEYGETYDKRLAELSKEVGEQGKKIDEVKYLVLSIKDFLAKKENKEKAVELSKDFNVGESLTMLAENVNKLDANSKMWFEKMALAHNKYDGKLSLKQSLVVKGLIDRLQKHNKIA